LKAKSSGPNFQIKHDAIQEFNDEFQKILFASSKNHFREARLCAICSIVATAEPLISQALLSYGLRGVGRLGRTAKACRAFVIARVHAAGDLLDHMAATTAIGAAA
jgi:hypothetical protein